MFTISLHKSRLGSFIQSSSHLLAGLALIVADIALILLPLGLLVVGASYVFLVWQDRDPACLRPQALSLARNRARLILSAGSIDCDVPGISFYSEWLLVLKFKETESGRRRSVNIWLDSLTNNDNWRLRRYLNGHTAPL